MDDNQQQPPRISTPRHSLPDRPNDVDHHHYQPPGFVTPSATQSTFAPRWSQLMPEASITQVGKRISTVHLSDESSSDDDEEDDDENDSDDASAAAAAIQWQSDNDLPLRRLMVQQILTLTETHRRVQQREDQSTLGLAKRIELSLYSRAGSLNEYRNLATLNRRLQALVSVSYHEAAARAQVLAKRRYSDSDIHLTKKSTSEFGMKRRRLTFLRGPTDNFGRKGQLFPIIGEDCVRSIFAFLSGEEVMVNRLINRFAADFLPSCVKSLEIDVRHLKMCLSPHDSYPGTNSLMKMSNLERLVVVKAAPDNAMDAQKTQSLHAWECAELDIYHDNEGEVAIQALARTLAAGACRHLRQLHLISIFTNTHERNGLRSLCNALARGCCPQLRNLLLGGNSICDAGTLSVARMLKSNAIPELSCLDLRRNYIGETGVTHIMAALAQGNTKNLKFLCMGGNIIADSSVPAVKNLLDNLACPKLLFLGLEDNFLTPEGVQTIIDAATTSGLAPKFDHLANDAAALQ